MEMHRSGYKESTLTGAPQVIAHRERMKSLHFKLIEAAVNFISFAQPTQSLSKRCTNDLLLLLVEWAFDEGEAKRSISLYHLSSLKRKGMRFWMIDASEGGQRYVSREYPMLLTLFHMHAPQWILLCQRSYLNQLYTVS